MFKQCFRIYVKDISTDTNQTELIFIKGKEKDDLEKLFDTIISDLQEDKTKRITIDMSGVK
ncbi:hypothetical protein [Enterococcus faecium]|uniref:Uncharacterized protein n=1 Tax=Enterococcus phage H1 TaxID=2982918 RepID=A0AAE9P7S3_9CAUD|nr:hypothetical protein [Enterococcus faecium]PHL10650.1 hypothetical protein CQR41_04660 [Enterococcus faecium]UYE92451.1 hypothetical protein H1_31 [Enterococcus phage H1]